MVDRLEEIMAAHDGEQADESTMSAQGAEERALLEGLQRADQAFRSEANQLLDIPVPTHLVDAIRQPAAQKSNVIAFPRWGGVIGLAAAAGFAAVIATNTQIFGIALPGTGNTVNSDSYAVHLQTVLESASAGEIVASADGAVQVMPVATFSSMTAGYCREFIAREGVREVAGFACREASGAWNVVTQDEELISTASGDYAAAEGAGDSRDPLTAIPDAEALSYTEEAAAIASKWRDSGS